MAEDKNGFEKFIKKGVNASYFTKMSLVEMHNLQNSRIWEIKIKDKEETIFAKLMLVQYVSNIPIGHFDIITNMFEVDEKKEKPILQKKMLHNEDIEGVHLTEMSL